jgi:AraC family ethanolamine operon transcriptional activator
MESMRFKAKFDHIRELGLLAGWDLGFRQLSRGRQALVGEFLIGQHVTVLDVRFNCAFHQLGYTPPGTVTVGIAYEGIRRWFGGECGPMNILPFNQASGFDCVSGESFAGWTLSISEEYLHGIADSCGLPFDDTLWRPDSETLIGESRETQSLCNLLRTYTRHSNIALNADMEERLAIALLVAAQTASRADTSRSAARSRALSTVLEYIRYHEHEPVKIREICTATGVAARTVERAFKESFGMGPKAYQQRLRLNAVRDELLKLGDTVKIADMANHWGFWHMGQFAKDYKALFGELPSETVTSGKP